MTRAMNFSESFPVSRQLPEVRDPLLALAIAFVAGILLSHGVPLGLWEAAVVALVFAAFALWSRPPGLHRQVRYACTLTALMSAGVFVDVWNRPGRAPSIDASSREIVLLSGCV